MATSTKAIKAAAKDIIKKNAFETLIAGIIFLFTFLICYYTASVFLYMDSVLLSSLIFYLMLFFIIAPTFLGLVRFYWRTLFGVCDNPIAVFYYFSDKSEYLKCIKLFFTVIVRALPVCFALYLPYLLVWLLTQNFTYDILNITMPLWTASLSNVAIILHIIADITIKLYFLKYYIAPTLFVANEEMSIKEILNMSRILSYKSAVDFIFLIISFVLWIVLSIFILPLVFTLPYMLLAFNAHIRSAIGEYNEHINTLNATKGFYEAVG